MSVLLHEAGGGAEKSGFAAKCGGVRLSQLGGKGGFGSVSLRLLSVSFLEGRGEVRDVD